MLIWERIWIGRDSVIHIALLRVAITCYTGFNVDCHMSLWVATKSNESQLEA